MEFKYRAIDERPPTLAPRPSSCSYFTQQALRAGYSWGAGFSYPNVYYQNLSEMPTVIWRELEKEKMREEMVAAEIARRRMLEAEVRREMMTRELAMHRGVDRFYFTPEPSTARFDSRGFLAPHLLHRGEGMPLGRNIKVSLEERLGMSAMLKQEFGGFDSRPFLPQRSSDPRIPKVMTAPESSKETEKFVVPAKPEASLSGMKRKAEIPELLGSTGIQYVPPEKKVREEWSCAMCEVSATSEQGLKEHLQGKKHRAREAGLKKYGKNYTIGLYPKNTGKTNNNPSTDTANNNPSLEQGKNAMVTSLQKGDKKNVGPSSSAKNKKPGKPAKTKEARVQRKQTDKESKKKKFSFWCETCKVGAFSQKVMEAHKKGKKHVARLHHQDKAEASNQVVQTQITETESRIIVNNGPSLSQVLNVAL